MRKKGAGHSRGYGGIQKSGELRCRAHLLNMRENTDSGEHAKKLWLVPCDFMRLISDTVFIFTTTDLPVQ